VRYAESERLRKQMGRAVKSGKEGPNGSLMGVSDEE